MRRRTVLKAAILAVAAGVSPLRLVEEALALGAVQKGVYRVKGDVRINGRPAVENMELAAGDVIVTGRGAELIFVAQKDAYLVRENSRVELAGTAGALLLTGLRVVTGAVLSVFERDRQKRIVTSTATIGVRGTGVYVESEPTRSYVCTCYGETEIAPLADPAHSERIATTHHEQPRYVYASGATMMVRAPVFNHTDAELALLEWVVGREPPYTLQPYK
jgi:hypothetical protein